MSCYIISYDLSQKNGENRNDDYKKIREAIETYGIWAKITESCYAVVSDKKSTEVRDHLKSFLNTSDRIFVVKSAGIAAWSNTICKSEWLKKNL